ncbi:hypothetical protein BT63DRAFT_426142 [Microthyrium microscopicum]|uniref:Uncharacterized protein n=1 Tax=Microthyrium microscopicum TaxID=703497 RepID=A0A6A6UCP9_9PEZI|nr:hypothetical protein BT63DRAFT_426142 [Microthyrium microscopicum]
MTCCCDTACSSTCPAFQQRQKLHDLEDKNTLAGELGQALLARHENYVAEAEKERRRMMDTIQSLEEKNSQLEDTNKRTIQENRDLLDQLESLNGAVKDSEAKVQSLSDVLHSTEYELERMNGLASRTEQLHQSLAQLEDDLAASNSAVVSTRDEHKAATLRWQRAERTITELQREIEQIEVEAKIERERHADVLSRMERRRAVENQLLQNRPWKRTEDSENGVVSHFVKDILQDNANLQLGIMELRDMLQRSNDEVEQLRDQVLLSPSLNEAPDPSGAQTPTLGSELGGTTRELHVHHHYHPPAKTETRKPRAPALRRKGKQRPSVSHTPRSSISLGPSTPSSSSAILNNTSVTIPTNRNSKRWSTQSHQTGFTSSSSLPSSPYTDSIFDRAFPDTATDISRPSSPDSLSLSPRNSSGFGGYDMSKRSSIENTISNPLIEPLRRSISENSASFSQKAESPSRESIHELPTTHSIILEENEDLDSLSHSPAKKSQQPSNTQPIQIHSPIRPTLRRAASHESLISIHGMDIHTLNTRPSQLLLGKYVAAPTTSASQIGLSDANALAVRSSPRDPHPVRSSSQSYLSSIAAVQNTRTLARKESKSSIGRVGGWMFGKWSVGIGGSAATKDSSPVPAPALSITNDTGRPASIDHQSNDSASIKSNTTTSTTDHPGGQSIPSRSTPSRSLAASPRKMFMRSPGINQSGPIGWLPPPRRLDPMPVMRTLDMEALQEGLEDG